MTTPKGTGVLRAHRSYQLAMLRVLVDGEPHHKDELKMAGMRACEPFDALGTFQRAHPEQERLLESLSGQERTAEAMRQQVEGSRILVGKALSHLVDRNLMETVSKDEKGRRETYQITDRGREYVKSPPDEAPYTPPVATATARCQFCGEVLTISDPSVWRLGQLWYRWRNAATLAGGGVSAARRESEPDSYAHNACLEDHFSPDKGLLNRIREIVAERFGFGEEDLRSPTPPGVSLYPTLLPRQMAVALAHHLVTNSNSELSALVNRSTSFISKAVREIRMLVAEDASVDVDGERVKIADLMDDLKAEIEAEL